MDQKLLPKKSILIIPFEISDNFNYATINQRKSRWIRLSDYAVLQMGFIFKSRFFSYKHVKDIINQIAPFGIIHYVMADCKDSWIYDEISGSAMKVKEVMDFMYAFVILIVCCGVCLVVFILEILHNRPEILIEKMEP